MKRVAAFVLAGGRSEGLATLTVPRSIAAVPFAGKYRLIDFTLSNCVNSELYKVAVLTQYAPLSLSAHLGRGEAWDLNRRDGGVTLLQPYARQEGARWYEGTADAIRQNLDVLETLGADRVFVISTDVLCKMDYSWIFEDHRKSGARATLAFGRVPYGETDRFGVSHLDDGNRILDFQEKPPSGDAPWAFMGVYLFETAYLVSLLREQSGTNLILDVLRPRWGTAPSGPTASRVTGRTSAPSRSTSAPISGSWGTIPPPISTTRSGASTPGVRSGRRPSSAPGPRW